MATSNFVICVNRPVGFSPCMPTRKEFVVSCTSSSLPLPVKQNDKMIWNELPHLLLWFHGYFCRRHQGVSALLYELCGITGNRCFFLNKKHLTTIIASVKRDVRTKVYLTTALSLEYITPVPCFSDSTFLSAALLTTFWQTSFKSEQEGALWIILSQQDLWYSWLS